MSEKKGGFPLSLNRWLLYLRGRQDVVLALIFVCAIFMMILPLPTFLVDGLIALNLSLSMLLLLISIYTSSPAEFSAFPSVLLVTTLYRLSLTISTSRLILLYHDAGEIITAFGNFVVGGNIVVGLIIFTILTIVQFIVITKGAERVAEVSARFSLDAMPGKQMSIDGDMRAGTIDADEAKRQRNLVQQESQLYGAMDGAMKFVKGDAIASIIVILVNILGGIAIGVMQQGMSVSEAASTYTVLSVGDGLVSQIPALIISITAGILVTRVPGVEQENLAADLFHQLGSHTQPLLVAAGILTLFALIPGFPAWAFGGFALLLGGFGYFLSKQDVPSKGEGSKPKGGSGLTLKAGADPLLAQLPESWSQAKVTALMDQITQRVFDRLGLAIPTLKILDEKPEKGMEDRLRLFLYQDLVSEFQIREDRMLCCYESEEAPEGSEPASFLQAGPNLCWVSLDRPEEEGCTFYRGEEILLYTAERVLLHYGKEFLGIQESRFLMDSMEQKYGELVKELQRQVPLARLTDVLQRLVEEGISVLNLRAIFEALVAWSAKEKDVVLLTEYVRIALKRQIVQRAQSKEGTLSVWNIGHALENLIRESIRQTTAGSYSALPPEQVNAVVSLVKESIGPSRRGTLLTVVDVRRYLRKMIEVDLFDVVVLSKQELGEDTRLEVLGNIEWMEEQHDA